MRIAADTLHHLTTNTGHVARTRRADVADDVIALLRPLVAAGDGRIPGPVAWWYVAGPSGPGWAAYTIEVAIGGQRGPIISAVCCWQAESSQSTWAQLQESVAERLGTAPPVPWLAVTLLPTVAVLGPEVAGMAGDLERCLFWTIAEL